jgi:hypothetical protein
MVLKIELGHKEVLVPDWFSKLAEACPALPHLGKTKITQTFYFSLRAIFLTNNTYQYYEWDRKVYFKRYHDISSFCTSTCGRFY